MAYGNWYRPRAGRRIATDAHAEPPRECNGNCYRSRSLTSWDSPLKTIRNCITPEINNWFTSHDHEPPILRTLPVPAAAAHLGDLMIILRNLKACRRWKRTK